MDFLTDWLTNWLKELLIGGIMGNLEGLFDTVNTQVGEIAAQVGTTPAAWHAGVFSLIRQLSETVILPIAGMVLTFVATYELIQMKSVDIGAVAPESLPDVSGMIFDTSLPREERIALFLQAVENPYCFCIGGIGVKIEFAESGPSLQDTLTDFLLRQKSGL
jgi:hypothetical protein